MATDFLQKGTCLILLSEDAPPAFCHYLGRVFNKLCQISLFAVLLTGPEATLYWTILESSFCVTVWHHLYIGLFSLS